MSEDAKYNRLPPGQRVGKYEVQVHLADGGMAAVYRALDTDLGRVVALKVLPPELAGRPSMLERFRREARAAARLQHKNIVAVYDVGEAAGLNYLAMEYVDGITLEKHIARKGRLPAEEARQIALQCARALAHAHSQGIVHRDIKPSNLLLAIRDKRLVVKLADLGLAIQLEREEDFRMTKAGMTVGTVDYMAPEQARDSSAVDTRSDIYALGCTLYHMLAGATPFPRGSMTERLVQHLEAIPLDVRQLNRDVPEAFAALLAKMLAKKPSARFQTPLELLKALEQLGPLPAPQRERGPTLAEADDRPPRAATPTVPVAATVFVPQARQTPAAPDDLLALADLVEGLLPPVTKAPEPTPVRPAADESLALRDAGATPTALPQPRSRTERPHQRKKPRPTDVTPAADHGPPPPVEEPVELPVRPPVKKRRPDPVPIIESLEDAPPLLEADDEPPVEVPHVTPAAPKWTMPIVPWWLYAAGCGLLLLLALPLLAPFLPERRLATKVETPPDAPVVVVPGKEKEKEPETPSANVPGPKEEVPPKVEEKPPPIDTAAAAMRPGDWPLAPLPPVKPPVKRETLPRAFLGPFALPPGAPLTAKITRVSRTPAPGSGMLPTLADALARAENGVENVVEIHDQGPLFLAALPAVEGKQLTLRAGAGFRPLLVWERSPGGASTLLTLRGPGRLTLAGLDVAVRRSDGPAPALTLFDLRLGDFQADDCTFALASKSGPALTLVRLGPLDVSSARPRVGCRFTRCYAHGPDLTALRLDGVPADVLIDRSLLVGSRPPLLQLRGPRGDDVAVHLVRSTLVAGNALVEARPAEPKTEAARLKVLTLDCVLARNDPGTAEGDLLVLADGATPSGVSWRAVGGVYAGWRRLLAGVKNIAGTELDDWQAQWASSGGEAAPGETWPNAPPAQLAELPAATFAVADTPVAFAASSAAGPVGCPLGVLPPELGEGGVRGVEPRPLAPLEVNATEGEPTIDPAADGLYHGEKIDLAKFKGDLGQYLQTKLQPGRSAPRVVVSLTGTGAFPISPLRVKGVAQLVIHVEPAKTPLVLEVDPRARGPRDALLEVERGSLELTGVHLHYENNDAAVVPPYLVKASGGNLVLTRCRLEGPLGQAPANFRGLLHFTGPSDPARPAVVRLRDNVLLSGKSILTLHGPNVQLQARGNVGLALGHALDLDLAGQPQANLALLLDHNTWAVRQGFVNVVGDRPDTPPTVLPALTVQAADNYFLTPFTSPPGPGVLLSASPTLLPHGLLAWHGHHNAFDTRLHATLTAADPAKPAPPDWQRLRGQVGAQAPLLIEPAADAKPLHANRPDLARLALPPRTRVEPGRAPPGADLARLGLTKK